MPYEISQRPDYDRFLEAARLLRGWNSPAEIVKRLNERGYAITEQMLSNWKTRGVSHQGNLASARIIGYRPLWVSTGEGEMVEGNTLPKASEPAINAYSNSGETDKPSSEEERIILAGYRASSAERKKIMLDIAATALAEQSTVKSPPAATSKAKQRSHRIADKTDDVLADIGIGEAKTLYKTQK